MGGIEKELKRNRKALEERVNRDDIKEKIAEIFEGKVGSPFSVDELKELYSEGERRYNEKIPPGYKDASKYKNPANSLEKRSKFGDFILWRQALNMAETEHKSIILVTDDQKEDWWLIASGKTVGARPELVREFCEVTGQQILLYTPNKFLEYSEKQLGAKVSEKTIGEIKAEHTARLAEAASWGSAVSRNKRAAAELRSASWFDREQKGTRRLREVERSNSVVSHQEFSENSEYEKSIRGNTPRRSELSKIEDMIQNLQNQFHFRNGDASVEELHDIKTEIDHWITMRNRVLESL